jgi:alkanesulfonate monooxygenase SsuD/methylene tetrahydromethanopterin reductase-like flavin-dependent oxidoreductase (luciferase family)
MWAMPTVFSERSGVLDQSCEAIGRDPATVRRSTQALVCLTESESEARAFIDAAGGRAAFAGTAKQFADLAAQWHDAGVDELVIPDWHLGTGTQRAESIEAITAALRE